jgi:hypothetical protein
MKNLVLVKHSIDSEEEYKTFLSIYRTLEPLFNTCSVIVQRESASVLKNIPIFDGKSIINFKDIGVALDTEAAIFMEKAPLKHPFFFPVKESFGMTKMPRIFNLDPVIELAEKTNEK